MPGPADSRPPVVACFATQGSGSLDERRIRRLLEPLAPVVLGFERSSRAGSAVRMWRELRRLDPELVVMEGTGLGGGLVVLAARLLSGRRFVVSSGDAVGPFLRARSLPLGILAGVYERLLCRLSAGYIGWTPYLVGRALTYGAPRAMTAANWGSAAAGAAEGRAVRERLGILAGVYERLLCRLSAGYIGWTPYLVGRALTYGAPRAMTAANWGSAAAGAAEGRAVRERLGIPSGALVFGLVGSLNWTARYGYCYGQELVRARLGVDRDDLHVLVVGDGDGRERLRALAGDQLDVTIHLPGRVAAEAVAAHLAAIDVASLPQSVDGVGCFRYTTKVSEYRSARLPLVTGQIPLGYDLGPRGVWRLPGDAPWDDLYVRALAELMTVLDRPAIEAHRPPDADADGLFDAARQQRQVSAFVRDVVERERRRPRGRPRRGRGAFTA